MNIKYKTIRRVRITSPMSEWEKVFDWCDKNGYHLKRWGPRRVSPGRVDVTKFLAIAEKEV